MVERQLSILMAARVAPLFARILCFVLFSILCQSARASTVLVLTPDLSGGYEEIIEAIRHEVSRIPPATRPTVSVVVLSSASSIKPPDDTVLAITIGVQTARQAAVGLDVKLPLLGALIPKSSYEAFAASLKSGRRHTAIYLDQSPQRQLDLVRAVLPNARAVGLILGAGSEKEADTFRMLATNRGLALMAESVARESELYPVLQNILKSSDALLALPDRQIINATTAQNLLLTSFRFRVPVFGYSASYVRAGALAAIYSTPAQIGVETAQVVREFLRSGLLPQPRHPRTFSLTVNRQLAQDLDLNIADDATLLQKVRQFEGLE